MGTINVIFVILRRTGSQPSRVISMARLPSEDTNSRLKRAKVKIRPALTFSNAEIMYHDLYSELNLKFEDLIVYDSPLVSFDRKFVILKGQIRLPVQAGLEVVEVDFIIVDAFSRYTAIVARPWLHALGVVSSTPHQKVKYLLGDWIEELVGDQSMARQCLVSVILY